jgi:hypothetical protein
LKGTCFFQVLRKTTTIGFNLLVSIHLISTSIQVERRVVEEALLWLMTLTGGWLCAATGLEKANQPPTPQIKKRKIYETGNDPETEYAVSATRIDCINRDMACTDLFRLAWLDWACHSFH